MAGSGSVIGDAPRPADGPTGESSGEPWNASKFSGSSADETAGGDVLDPFPAAGLGPHFPDSSGGRSAAPPGDGRAAGPEGGPTGSSERWTSEAVLDRGLWRERPPEPWASRGAPAALEREDAPRLGLRIKRAVAVPVLAGAVVLVAAVLIAIAVAALQPGGAGMELAHAPGAEGHGGDASEGGSGAAASGSPNASGGSDGVAGSGADDVAGGAEVQRILVHVVGEVARPGVIEVVNGARVSEAIEAAGGASEAAVLSAVNLARAVVDGEQIVVPNAQQVQEGAVPGAAAGGRASATAGAPAVIDLNTADAGALETLPRVGPALAQRILEWRAANGRFATVDQLLDVPGIGAKILDGMRERVRV